MTVFTIAVNDQTGHFEHRCSEVSFICKALEIACAELQRNQGDKTSGTIVGMDPIGNANVSLGSWTYTPSGTLA